jgi:uncharacterized damage-inducible protein DinB
MTTSSGLKKLFADLYNGQPWTEITLTDILEGITAEQAAAQLIPNANTIWQLVQHCIGWRDNVLAKLNGAVFLSPEDNYLSMPQDVSETAWQTLLLQLKKSEQEWETFLETMDENLLQSPYLPSKGKFTVFDVIHGILHHDNYHFGQIMMLKKLL